MAILVDEAVWPFRGRLWAHLASDESIEELHRFAGRLGVSRRAFHGDHYDISEEQRAEAIDLGAAAVPGRELVRRLRDSGLRLSRDRRAAYRNANAAFHAAAGSDADT